MADKTREPRPSASGVDYENVDRVAAAREAGEGVPLAEVDAEVAKDAEGPAEIAPNAIDEGHTVSDGTIGSDFDAEAAAIEAGDFTQQPGLDPTPKRQDDMTPAERRAAGIPAPGFEQG